MLMGRIGTKGGCDVAMMISLNVMAMELVFSSSVCCVCLRGPRRYIVKWRWYSSDTWTTGWQRLQQWPSIPTQSPPRSPLSSAHLGLDGNINPAQILEDDFLRTLCGLKIVHTQYTLTQQCSLWARVGPAQFVDGEGLALLNPIRTEWKMKGWNVEEIWHNILLPH